MKKIIVLGTDSPGGIKTVIDSYEKQGVYQGFEYIRIVTHQQSGYISNGFRFIKSLLLLLKYIIFSCPIIHVHASMRGSFVRKSLIIMLANIFKCKVIYHLHGSEFKIFIDSMPSVIRWYAIWIFEQCDVFIVLSQSWQFYVDSLGNINTVVINNSVDDYSKRLSIQAPSNNNNLCFLGALGQRKGIFDLLQACKRLKEDKISFHLSIGGNGEVDKTLELISKLQLEEHCSFLGWIGVGQKLSLLKNSSILILPSYNEGLPMVVLEALACKTAVISSPVGGIPELINNNKNGILVNPGDIEEIYLAIKLLLENKSLYKEIAISGYKTFSQKYSADVTTPKIKDLYKSLV